MAEDGEHQDPGGEAGAGVDHAGNQRVPVAVVVELVVGAQSRQGTGANTMLIKKCVFLAPTGAQEVQIFVCSSVRFKLL